MRQKQAANIADDWRLIKQKIRLFPRSEKKRITAEHSLLFAKKRNAVFLSPHC